MAMLSAKIISELSEVVYRYKLYSYCDEKEKEFLFRKSINFTIPHFHIIWTILKNPVVCRPNVAGYTWILTSAFIFVGHYGT